MMSVLESVSVAGFLIAVVFIVLFCLMLCIKVFSLIIRKAEKPRAHSNKSA